MVSQVGGIMERDTAGGAATHARVQARARRRFYGTLIRIHMSSSLSPTGMWRW